MKQNLIVMFLLISFGSQAQGVLTAKNIKIDFSGFVRNDFIFDSRQNVDACDHLLEFFPQKPNYDMNNEDINAQPSAQFLNTFSRVGTRFSGLEMGKAQVSGYIEIDFTGGSQTPTLRLRHANTQIAWENSSLLIGRAWHPTFIEKVYPSVLNENTGLPFQVFNRSPQIRFTQSLSQHVDLIVAAVYQYDYSNTGPIGKTYHYQRDAVIPNLHAQIQFFDETWVIGAAFDWKSIQPRTSTLGAGGNMYKTNEKLNTMAFLAYLKYSKEMFEFKAKSMFGQNVCESLLPSGYAVATIDALTGAETYTPLNHIYNWVNFTYGNAWKVGMFAGYLKNLGASDIPIGPFYGMATDIDMIYKISPQLIYTYKNFMFGWEISWTTAAYGDYDYTNFGKIKNAENVTNFRNMLSVAYSF